MSWRDRLARQDPATATDVDRAKSADSSAPKAIGTIGTIGNGEFSSEIASVNALPGKTGRSIWSNPISGKVLEADHRSANSAGSADSFDFLLGGSAWIDEHEERAAIVEHDGRIPRSWAEGFARLDPDHPPAEVPLERWQRFVDDVGSFLDSSFCAVAAALGWGPHDLFGYDRHRPLGGPDPKKAGLLWLMNGNRLVALSENTATIETTTGAHRTLRCKPHKAGRALAWELGP